MKRALIVIDVQREYFEGAFPIRHPTGHLGYEVEFLSDATATLDVSNKAGSVTAEQLHESILVAQQMFISDVIDRKEWLNRIRSALSLRHRFLSQRSLRLSGSCVLFRRTDYSRFAGPRRADA